MVVVLAFDIPSTWFRIQKTHSTHVHIHTIRIRDSIQAHERNCYDFILFGFFLSFRVRFNGYTVHGTRYRLQCYTASPRRTWSKRKTPNVSWRSTAPLEFCTDFRYIFIYIFRSLYSFACKAKATRAMNASIRQKNSISLNAIWS